MQEDNSSRQNTQSTSYQISQFASVTATTPLTKRETSRQIIKRLSKPAIRATKNGPLWSPAIYAPPRRTKGNVKELCALALDCDHDITFDEAAAILRNLGVTAIMHTTYSHTPQAHRFRIIILLATPITPREYSKLFRWARKLFNDRIDIACSDPGRMFFWPAVPNREALKNFRFQNFIGAGLLDWGPIIEAMPDESDLTATLSNQSPINPLADPVQPNDNYIAAAIASEVERVRSAQAGQRNNDLHLAAYHSGQLQIDLATVESALTEAALQAGLSPREIKTTIRSGYNAGLKKPRIIQSRRVSMNTSQQEQKTKSQTTNNANGAGAQGAQAKQQTTSGNGAGAQAQAQTKRQPITRVIKGLEFTADDTSLRAGKVGKKQSDICSPLFIEADTRNARGEGWGRLLVFYDREGREKSWVMPLAYLAGNRTKYREKLLDMGLRIAPGKEAATWLHIYLHDQPKEIALSVDRVGWADDSFVFPDKTFSAQVGRRIYLQASGVNNLLQTSGTLSQWRQSIGQYCIGNSHLTFAVSAAFAAALLTPFGISGGGFHLMGGSSSGKSTTQYVAGSVWGGGGKHGYVQSWKSSSVGLEYLSEYHNDNFLPLDEIGLANPKEIGQSVYMVMNGCGKNRGQPEGGLRKQPTWTVLVLSSGEKTLREYMAEADQKIMDGQEVRLIHLPADAGAELGVFEDLHRFRTGKEFSDHLRQESKQHYGTPIRAFLNHLISQQLVVTSRQQFETYKRKFIEDNLKDKSDKLAGRAADLFAVVGFAGKLASEWSITGWPVAEATKAAAKLFQDWLAFREQRDGGEDAGVRRVIEFIQRHGASRFQFVGDGDPALNGEKIINRAGFKKYKIEKDSKGHVSSTELVEYAIFPEVFKNEVCEGLNCRDVARKLKERGLLAKADGENLAAYRTFGEFKRQRYYVILNEGLDDTNA
jgi:uncharacterized protein (DUF927 family)